MSYRYRTPLPILQQLIDSRHFAELLAEESLEPRGELREDYRAALVAQTVHNSNAWGGGKALPLSDFLLKWRGDESEDVDPKEAARKAAAEAARWVRHCGGEVTTNG